MDTLKLSKLGNTVTFYYMLKDTRVIVLEAKIIDASDIVRLRKIAYNNYLELNQALSWAA